MTQAASPPAQHAATPLAGTVALITGAARGQGRADAIRLAAAGANIIALDLAGPLGTTQYPGSTPEDLAETVRLVEATGRTALAVVADVRSLSEMRTGVDAAVQQLGGLHTVVADAGAFALESVSDISEASWNEIIGVNLTGIWNTVQAALPHLRASGGGSIVLMNASLGLKGYPDVAHMVAAKHGAVGLMKVLALELAPEHIRVNMVNPSTINTPMVQNEWFYTYLAPELTPEERTPEVMHPLFTRIHPLGNRWAEPEDVAEAVLFLASDSARCITGVTLPVDGGTTLI